MLLYRIHLYIISTVNDHVLHMFYIYSTRWGIVVLLITPQHTIFSNLTDVFIRRALFMALNASGGRILWYTSSPFLMPHFQQQPATH